MRALQLFFRGRTKFYQTKIRFSSFLIILTCLLASFLFQLNTASAQFVPCTGCTANDDHVDSVVLVQKNPAYESDHTQPEYISLSSTCEGSTQVTGYLKISFNQNATTRYGISLAGNILVDGQYSQTFTFCDDLETNSGPFVKYVSNFPITYTCGTKLELKDLFIGWGHSAGANPCIAANLNDPICEPAPHCEQLPLTPGGPPIVVVTPLSADFAATGSCASGKTAQTYSFNATDATSGTTGGTPPYSYNWKIVNKSTSVQVGTMTGATPSFDFSQAGAGAGDYTVTLTVTDATTPSPIVSTVSKDISVISCCLDPNAGTDGTLTVCTGTTPTQDQLFEALEGNPSSGGTWSAAVNGVYTYTVTAQSPCTNTASATVTVTEAALPNAGTNGTLSVCTGTTPTNDQLFAQLGGSPTAGGVDRKSVV